MKEVSELQKEIIYLKRVNDISKKIIAVFAKGVDDSVMFIFSKNIEMNT